MIKKPHLIVVILIICSVSASFGEENPDIDWEKGRIYSSYSVKTKMGVDFAEDRLKEIEFAKDKAKVNFYRILKTVNIYESISVLDYLEERSEKNRELFSLIDKAKLYRIEYPSVNAIKLVYFIDIFGEDSLMNIMMSERDIFTEDLTGYAGFYYDTKYSGVIIDARGLLQSYDGHEVKVRPSLFITIRDSEGRVVLGRDNVLPDVIRKEGMVKYSFNIYGSYPERVGLNPLKVSALGVGDRSGSHIVITEQDAKRMLASEMTRNALKNGKMVIVIEP